MIHSHLPVIWAGIIALAANPGLALDLKAWDAATNPETKERYIPVELWSGAEWDGKRELKMPKVDASYKHSESYRIKGPTEWKHPDRPLRNSRFSMGATMFSKTPNAHVNHDSPHYVATAGVRRRKVSVTFYFLLRNVFINAARQRFR